MSENDLARWIDLVESTLQERLTELATRVHNLDGEIDASLHYLVTIIEIKSLTILIGSEFHNGADNTAHLGRRGTAWTDSR